MRIRRPYFLILVLTCAAGIVAIQYWPTARRKALDRVQALQGTYAEQWDEEEAHPANVVMLPLRPVTEQDLAALCDIRPLHRVLLDGSPVTDEGLAHLARIEELELLSLIATPVTDAGLVHLRGLKRLKILTLRRTAVTDSGLVHLGGLPRLQVLNVLETRVTERGVEELRRQNPNLRLVFLHEEAGD